MCIVESWDVVYPDGRRESKKRVLPCSNGDVYTLCPQAEFKILHNQFLPEIQPPNIDLPRPIVWRSGIRMLTRGKTDVRTNSDGRQITLFRSKKVTPVSYDDLSTTNAPSNGLNDGTSPSQVREHPGRERRSSTTSLDGVSMSVVQSPRDKDPPVTFRGFDKLDRSQQHEYQSIKEPDPFPQCKRRTRSPPSTPEDKLRVASEKAGREKRWQMLLNRQERDRRHMEKQKQLYRDQEIELGQMRRQSIDEELHRHERDFEELRLEQEQRRDILDDRLRDPLALRDSQEDQMQRRGEEIILIDRVRRLRQERLGIHRVRPRSDLLRDATSPRLGRASSTRGNSPKAIPDLALFKFTDHPTRDTSSRDCSPEPAELIEEFPKIGTRNTVPPYTSQVEQSRNQLTPQPGAGPILETANTDGELYSLVVAKDSKISIDNNHEKDPDIISESYRCNVLDCKTRPPFYSAIDLLRHERVVHKMHQDHLKEVHKIAGLKSDTAGRGWHHDIKPANIVHYQSQARSSSIESNRNHAEGKLGHEHISPKIYSETPWKRDICEHHSRYQLHYDSMKLSMQPRSQKTQETRELWETQEIQSMMKSVRNDTVKPSTLEQEYSNSHPHVCSICFESFESRTILLRHGIDEHSKPQPALETPDDVDSSSDESQGDSVFTRRNRCSSISSMPQIPIWREARDVIVPIIARNAELMLLYSQALQDGGANCFDLFEQCFRQFFGKYCFDLKTEADDIPRKEAVKILKLSGDKILYEIRELCEPVDHVKKSLALLKQQRIKKHEEVEQYLRRVGLDYDKAGIEATEAANDQNEDMDADSDPDDDQVSKHLFPNINHIKTFMISSQAFTTFHESLHDFVYQIQTAKDAKVSIEQLPPRFDDDKLLWKDHRHLVPPVRSHKQPSLAGSPWISSLISVLRDKLRPSLKDGQQRVTWKCGCGKPMYADVEELYPGGADALQSSLRKAGVGSQKEQDQLTDENKHQKRVTMNLQQVAADSIRTHNQSNNEVSSKLQPLPEASDTTELQHEPTLTPSSTSTTLADTELNLTSSGDTVTEQQQVMLPQQFLLLCVSTTRTAKLEQIQIPYNADDQVMFQDIRRAYLKVRQARSQTFHPETPALIRRLVQWNYDLLTFTQRSIIKLFQVLRLRWLVWWIGDMVFYIPTSANFVRFELIPIKTEICPEVISFPDLPPTEEVHVKKTYHYAPCPQSVKNPLLRIPYLHVLFEPGNHLDRFWSNRVPKKLDTKIIYRDGIEPVIGWGVHIVEGPNWVAFSVLSEIVLVLSAVLALVWSLLAKDVSGGFAIGAYVVGALAVGNALGIVRLCQQH
ncbi:hypothetical protein MMC13_004500 [Lambiella insularis]|nr:hypothetical protein [Lambiella insularis]